MKFILAGYGFVGKAIKSALKDKHTVEVVDPQFTTNEIKFHYDADGVIICVSTPSDENGNCDISNVLDVLSQVPVHIPVLIKSTISPDLVRSILDKYT
jgi:UDP-glucose 6-dehydrogenase